MQGKYFTTDFSVLERKVGEMKVVRAGRLAETTCLLNISVGVRSRVKQSTPTFQQKKSCLHNGTPQPGRGHPSLFPQSRCLHPHVVTFTKVRGASCICLTKGSQQAQWALRSESEPALTTAIWQIPFLRNLWGACYMQRTVPWIKA